MIAIGASETAAHVAEERRFEQRIRNAGAVERDERRERAVAALVDQPCDHFLPDAAFAGDEHLRVGTRRVLDLELDGPNRGADAQERFGGVAAGRRARGGRNHGWTPLGSSSSGSEPEECARR